MPLKGSVKIRGSKTGKKIAIYFKIMCLMLKYYIISAQLIIKNAIHDPFKITVIFFVIKINMEWLTLSVKCINLCQSKLIQLNVGASMLPSESHCIYVNGATGVTLLFIVIEYLGACSLYKKKLGNKKHTQYTGITNNTIAC